VRFQFSPPPESNCAISVFSAALSNGEKGAD